MATVKDYEDRVLISGGGIVAFYSAQFLASRGVKVLLVHSSEFFRDIEAVYFNGSLDSTYSDAHGKGGLSKFWEFQLMKPSICAFQTRPWISKSHALSHQELFDNEGIELQKELGLHSFSNLRLPWIRKLGHKSLIPVLSQFLPRSNYQEIFRVESSQNIEVFEGFLVHSFKENIADGSIEVEVRDLEGRVTKILCASLVLAAGTIGNAKILNSTQISHKKNLWPTLGKSVQDHQIINLGIFRPRHRNPVRFAIPTFRRHGYSWKQKFQITNLSDSSWKIPDFALEVTPLLSAHLIKSGAPNRLKKLSNALSNWVFRVFAFDLHHKKRSVQCELLTEDYHENRMELAFMGNNVFIQNLTLPPIVFDDIRLLSIQALKNAGYESDDPTFIMQNSAYHLMGSTPIGESAADSVVDATGSLHGFRKVKVLGLSSLSPVGFVNPTFSALVNARIFLEELIPNS